MRIIKNIENPFVSDAANQVIVYLCNILDSLEIRVEDEDYLLVDDRKAIVSINKNNMFLRENDKKGIQILMLKRILPIKFSGRLSELLVYREIIKLGLDDKLF